MAPKDHHPLAWQTGMFPATHRHLRLDIWAHHDEEYFRLNWNVWEGLDNQQVALQSEAMHRGDDSLILIGVALTQELKIFREGLRPWEG